MHYSPSCNPSWAIVTLVNMWRVCTLWMSVHDDVCICYLSTEDSFYHQDLWDTSPQYKYCIFVAFYRNFKIVLEKKVFLDVIWCKSSHLFSYDTYCFGLIYFSSGTVQSFGEISTRDSICKEGQATSTSWSKGCKEGRNTHKETKCFASRKQLCY